MYLKRAIGKQTFLSADEGIDVVWKNDQVEEYYNFQPTVVGSRDGVDQRPQVIYSDMKMSEDEEDEEADNDLLSESSEEEMDLNPEISEEDD
jgi:hypothetical protein